LTLALFPLLPAGPSAKKLTQAGLHFLDAPCTGSKPGAEGGNLTFMIGGDKDVFERVRPYFEPMGKKLYYCGGPGMGLHAKLTQNLILSNLLQAFNEGMVLAAKAGVDAELMFGHSGHSAAKSADLVQAPYVFAGLLDKLQCEVDAYDIGLMLQPRTSSKIPP
jgi:3-hydroxyisobutyrate dehydrogenase/2-hydroxy-3-oxopropionate reductase